MYKQLLLLCFVVMFTVACFGGNEDGMEWLEDIDLGDGDLEVDELIFDEDPIYLTLLVFNTNRMSSQVDYTHLDKHIEEFEVEYENTTIRINNIYDNEDHEQLFQLDEIIERIKPDMVEVSPYHMNQLKDKIVDLHPYLALDGIEVDQFYPSLIEASTVEGELKAIPLFYNMFLTLYNKNALHEKGLQFPEHGWTWEEAVEISEQVNFNIPFLSSPLEQSMMSSGHYFLSPDYVADGYLNSSGMNEALDWLLSHFENTNPYCCTIDELVGGHQAEITIGSLLWNNRGLPDEQIGVAGLPYFQEGERVQSIALTGLAILESSDNKEEAWDFIRHSLVDDNEVSQNIAKEYYMSTRYSVSSSSGMELDPIGSVVIRELEYAQPSRLALHYWYTNFVDPNGQSFIEIRDGEDIQSILNDMAARWDIYLAGLRHISSDE